MKISIVGIGPGNPKYMLPAAADIFKNSDVIIGGKRNLAHIDTAEKETIEIADNFSNIIEYIKKNHKTKKISLAASGDPGFFGILRYMRKHFSETDLEVIPGISSVQYFFAKLNLPWDDFYLASVHGRDDDPVQIIKKHNRSVFLTDKERTYKYIAELLQESGFGDYSMYVGNNLSYDDESIIQGKVKDIALMNDEYNLCVVVVLNEK